MGEAFYLHFKSMLPQLMGIDPEALFNVYSYSIKTLSKKVRWNFFFF